VNTEVEATSSATPSVAEQGADLVRAYLVEDQRIFDTTEKGAERTASYKANKTEVLAALEALGLSWTRGMIPHASPKKAHGIALAAFEAQLSSEAVAA